MKNFFKIVSRYFLAITGCLLTIASCDSKQSFCVTPEQIIRPNPGKVIIVDTALGKTLEILDEGGDSLHAGDYAFYETGCLKSYKFFGSMNAYSYNEEYDRSGKLVKMEGNPLVYKEIDYKYPDRIHFTFYFFALNKEYTPLKFWTSANDKFQLPLIDDTVFTNMKRADYYKDVTGMKTVTVAVEISYKRSDESTYRTIKDTTSLSTSDRLQSISYVK